jgi:hypothetical protein
VISRNSGATMELVKDRWHELSEFGERKVSKHWHLDSRSRGARSPNKIRDH